MDISFEAAEETSPIVGLEIDVSVLGGRNLRVMDKSFFGKGSSDPYVKVYFGNPKKGPLNKQFKIGKTKVIKKSLNPIWADAVFKHHVQGKDFVASSPGELLFRMFDKDKMSADDPMGEVRLSIHQLMRGQPIDKWLPLSPYKGCKKAKGEVHLKVSVAVRRAICLKRGMYTPISGRILVGLGWDMLKGGVEVDLDTSCVGVDAKGSVLMDETVYFADLSNSNGSIRHSGDEREGDEDLGQGDDEIITVDLDRVPRVVKALFFIATVASPGKTFADVKTAKIRLVDGRTGVEMSRFMPALKGQQTALFVLRLARDKIGWALSVIGDVDHTARDFGTLVPEIKGYMRDIVPGIKIDPFERIAVMRKGGTIRLREYCHAGTLPTTVTFGLAWDVTDGVNIDLDASAILLDARLQLVDLVFFGQLRSKDGSIQHMGDEREGDEKGDDEKIQLNLQSIHPSVQYIGFTVNSYSGQELDDVKDAKCHLFDTGTYKDIAKYELTNTKELDKHTALVMGCLYRDSHSGEWCLRIISEAAQGRTAKDNIDELQNFLKRNPPQPLGVARQAHAFAAMPQAPIPGAAVGVPARAVAVPAMVVAAPAAFNATATAIPLSAPYQPGPAY